MRYSLADVFSVRKGRGLPAACALPTVLDGGMHLLALREECDRDDFGELFEGRT